MIKKQHKWIAWFVTVTFIWLLHVSAMPLAANGTAEQISAAGSEQGPAYIEEAGTAGGAAGKKSILPYVLIGAGVLAAAAVLFLVVLKTSYDITGSWRFKFISPGEEFNVTIVFTGTKKSGTTEWVGIPKDNGTYSVDDKNVTIILAIFPAIQVNGQFTGKDSMSGTLDDGEIWTWTATRLAAAADAPQASAAQPTRFPH